MSFLTALLSGLFTIGIVALLVRNAGGLAQIINAFGANYAGILSTAGGLPRS